MPLFRCLFFLIAWLPLQALSAQQYTVKVVDKKPQPRENFVQGLEIVDDLLYVSTGNYGHSQLLRYNFSNGSLDIARKLNGAIFAEGVTLIGDRIYQLTWKNRVMLIYQQSDLKFLKMLPFASEGWGLTNNGTELIYSDGSAQLHFMSPETAQIRRSIRVTDNGSPVHLLNELEWVDGAIWANVWHTDRIVIIDPVNGEVTGNIDLRGLLPDAERRRDTNVLNGIARNPADGAIWVTGKHWPWLYRIELVPTGNEAETQQSHSNSR